MFSVWTERRPARFNFVVQADFPVSFTQLAAQLVGGKTAGGEGGPGVENLFDLSLSQALGTAAKTDKFDFASSKLGKVTQLAGFSDPVYAEAFVNVNQCVSALPSPPLSSTVVAVGVLGRGVDVAAFHSIAGMTSCWTC